jgi:hypothetical protein
VCVFFLCFSTTLGSLHFSLGTISLYRLTAALPGAVSRAGVRVLAVIGPTHVVMDHIASVCLTRVLCCGGYVVDVASVVESGNVHSVRDGSRCFV